MERKEEKQQHMKYINKAVSQRHHRQSTSTFQTHPGDLNDVMFHSISGAHGPPGRLLCASVGVLRHRLGVLSGPKHAGILRRETAAAVRRAGTNAEVAASGTSAAAAGRSACSTNHNPLLLPSALHHAGRPPSFSLSFVLSLHLPELHSFLA